MKHYLNDLGLIFKITFSILLFITLPLVLFTLVTSKTSVFGIKSYVVVSGSMTPSLPIGTLVFAKNQTSYKTGDIITFIRENKSITHRVISVSNSKSGIVYQTKGDANKVADTELVPGKDVIGRMSFYVLNIGWFIHYLKTIPGFLIFIVLPVLIFIGFEVKNIKNEMERHIKRKIMQEFESIPVIKQFMEVIER